MQRPKNLEGWTLIYGRRKVGKSFLVRKYINYDLYYYLTLHPYLN
ncbi:hypothetical protein [Saccharolobus caldissimus]|nr:hypothetical protein [Saccharolobus caldissimus]